MMIKYCDELGCEQLATTTLTKRDWGMGLTKTEHHYCINHYEIEAKKEGKRRRIFIIVFIVFVIITISVLVIILKVN